MNGTDYERLDRAVDRLSDKLSARFNAVDSKLDSHGERLTGIETLMGERCKVNTDRLAVLEQSEKNYGRALAKHAVVIGLALTAIGALVVAGMKLVLG